MMTAPPAWASAVRRRLVGRLDAALRRSRRRGRGLVVSASVAADPGLDVTALITASRRPGEPWLSLEQPARDQAVLGALGCVTVLEATRANRFASVAGQWARLIEDAVFDSPAGPPGAGLVATGGFAFSGDGASSELWTPFASGSLIVPELALARRRRGDGSLEVRATLSARVMPSDTPESVLARVDRRLSELRAGALPELVTDRAGPVRVAPVTQPADYAAKVARAVELIRRNEIEKVVLAREVDVHAAAPYDPAALLGVLRVAFPECFVFGVGRGSMTLVAASPELLVRREGLRATGLALAGSTRRSADPAVDDHLGEQLLRSAKDRSEHAIVARRIAAALGQRSVWVTMPPEPTLVRIANIQHLATPIRAQLNRSVDVLELVGTLHPSPAVGGEPSERAQQLIGTLEGIDRGWYAGPVGWIDSSGDGEFCVALRCALLDGTLARCYAGAGVVADSDPATELAETELKLGALLPLLSG